MTQDSMRGSTTGAALALHRFGLGPRPGSIAAMASDPRGALIAELDRPGISRIDNPELMSSAASSRAAFEARAARQAQQVVADRAKKQAEQERAERMANNMAANDQAQNEMAAADAAQSASADKTEANKPASAPQAPPPLTPERQYFLKEVKARIDASLAAEIGFAERLVWFWSNHFCVSADKGRVREICGAYEREAIRAHLLGRFGDMLLAVESHPAMLLYLDNARSIGPDSIAGIRRRRGLNENLAREILELHTLGVRTVYTQQDVTRFANVLTGWTVVPPRELAGRFGEFEFNPRMHEPGAQTVIGTSYADPGVEQGRAVLVALARHPATAKHIATKLARHFVADEPGAGRVPGARTKESPRWPLAPLASAA